MPFEPFKFSARIPPTLLCLGLCFAVACTDSNKENTPSGDMGGTGGFDLGLDTSDSGLESFDAGLDTADALHDASPNDAKIDTTGLYPEAALIDGVFGEWGDRDILLVDPAGDAVGAFDITRVHARSRGTVLYLHFDVGSELNLQSGNWFDGQIRLDILVGDARLTVDFRGRSIYRDGNPDRWITWQTMSMTTAPTHTSTEFEMQIDLGEIGAKRHDEVTLSFDGSDRTEEALFALDAPAVPPAPLRTATRGAGATIRIANLNTKESGLSNSERAGSIGRLLAAVDADIYCFQEEFETQDSAISSALRTLTGKDGWSVYRVRASIIATRGRMEPVESENQRYAAARVQVSGGPEILAISYHGSCCGYAGSEEDAERISEAQALVRTVDAHRDIPAVVIGDWNLVGSRTPLSTLEASGLERWHLESLRPGDFWTWYNPRSRFTPGQLDLLVHDPTRLERVHGYILSTHTMQPEEAEALGLRTEDSGGSDHQVLVGDFK